MHKPRRGLTVGRLMSLIAGLGVILGAWVYRRENGDVDRALATRSIRELAGALPLGRLHAVEDLARAEAPDPGPILSALGASALGDADPTVRAGAVRALVSVFVRSIRDRKGKPTPAETARDAPSVRTLIRALGDSDPQVCVEALRAFRALQPAFSFAYIQPPMVAPELLAEAGPTLTGLLDQGDRGFRDRAADALVDLQPPPVEARDYLLDLLGREGILHQSPGYQERLIQAWPAAELVPAVLDRWRRATGSAQRRRLERCLIGILDPPPAASIPALLDLMRADPAHDPDLPLVFLKLGPGARADLGALAELARSELDDPAGKLDVALVVPRIDPTAPEAQTLLAPAVRLLSATDDPTIRERAGLLLSLFGPSGAPAVPALRGLLASPTAAIRLHAVETLGAIGPAAKDAIADLGPLRDADPEPAVRRAAATSLQIIQDVPNREK